MTNLFINFFTCMNEIRAGEYFWCLNNNISNKYIDKIYIFHEGEQNLPSSSKLVIIPTTSQITYKKFFEYINTVTKEDDINIICNLDIYFDNTISLTRGIKKNQCLALNRWRGDIHNPILHGHGASDSQDTWIFRGRIRIPDFCDFHLGRLGCDNRIAWELNNVGYSIYNPSNSIRTFHKHESEWRNFDIWNDDQKIPPPYLLLPPTDLDIVVNNMELK